MHELPCELLGIILQKVIIFKSRPVRKQQLKQLLELCISQQNERDDILHSIASCNSDWYEKMRTPKFRRNLKRYRQQVNFKEKQIVKRISLDKSTSINHEVLLKQMKAKDVMHCPVCNNIYSDPVKLPCTHVFCLECMRKLKMSTSDNTLSCPLCLKEVFSPDGSVENLPKATFLARLVQISKPPNTSADENLCEECKALSAKEQPSREIPQAVIYCEDCDQILCKDCHQRHLCQIFLKGHTLHPLGSRQQGMSRFTKKITCDKHSTQPVTLYCKNCRTALCIVCKIDKNEGHDLHDCSLISDVVGEYRKRLTEDVLSTSGMTTEITEHHVKLSKELEHTQQAKNFCEDQLAYISTIRTRNLYMKQTEIEMHLSAVKQFSLYSEALQHSGSDIEIIREFDALKEKANELQESHELLSRRPIPTATVMDSPTNAEMW